MATKLGKRKGDLTSENAAWKERLQFLSDTMESASQPFCAVGIEGEITIFNGSFCRLTGYAREDLFSVKWTTVIDDQECRSLSPQGSRTCESEAKAPEETEAKVPELLDGALEPQRYEKPCRRKDGSVVPVELLARVASDSQGNILHYYYLLTDVSDRKRKEETVRSEMKALEARAAEHMADLQSRAEEIEVQAEEIEAQNEELRVNNDELEKLTLALQEREAELAKLAAIVTSSNDAIIGRTLDGVITSWNAGAEKMYGYTAAEAIGHPIDFIVPPKLIGEIRGNLRGVRAGHRIDHYTTQRVSKDGRLIDVLATISPIVGRDSSVVGVSTIDRDITEARQAENALRKSQYILAKSQEMARVGNWAWNIQTGEVKGSEETYRLYGYEPGEVDLTIEWIRNCAQPEYRTEVDAFADAVRRDGSRRSVDYCIRRPDGAMRYLTTVADKVVRDRSGQVTRVYGVTQDITGRKLAEEALRENGQRLARSQSIAHLGSWELDLVTNRLSWSDEVYRIFGLEPQEFRATYEAFLEAVHPDDRAAVDAVYSGSIRDGKDSYEIEHRIVRRRSGEVRIVHEKCEHFRDESGRIIRSAGMIHDITERKRLEDALREREQQLASRLNAILSPDSFDEKTISEIVDLSSLNEMANSFHALTGVANAIIDLNGTVLVGAGWQDICTKFHRAHPEACKNCVESDRHLSGCSVEEGKYVVYKCKNGLWDAATPIIVNGRHIANLFIGQFFFEDEVPDIGYFERQAEKYGFDRNDYMAALSRVPRHDRAKIDRVMAFYTRFAAMVSQLSYSNVQLAQSLIRQKESEKALQEKVEEIEVQREEIEVQNEELRTNNEELENVTRALQERKAELAKLAAIVTSSDDAIIGKTLDGVITSWNAGAEKMYGYTAAEAIGHSIGIIMLPELSRELSEILDKISMGLRVVRQVTQRVTKDGRTIDALITVSPIFDGTGKVVGASTIARDITDMKLAEERLKEAKAQSELYLDLMGHDISNMHQIALSQLELAQEIVETEGKLDGNDLEMIVTPIETLQKSARLIDNVRNLQKLRAGEYRLESIDIGEMLAEIVEDYSAPGLCAAINHRLTRGCYVKANPLLKEAFANIVGNAIKHSGGHPTVNIGVSKVFEGNAAFYRVTIEDDGPGIPDDKKSEVFHRFKRGQTKAKGTGLGLYIVWNLIENFGGRVWVEDRLPGNFREGSKFIVHLPVAENGHE